MNSSVLDLASAASSLFPDAAPLKHLAAQFAPTPLTVDAARLTANDRQPLIKLIEAGRVIDDIFLRQTGAATKLSRGNFARTPRARQSALGIVQHL
jgi:hypothetical protein